MTANSQHIMICKVDHSWYSIIKSEYFSAGTNSTNFWTVECEQDLDPALRTFEPGTMVLYVLDHHDHSFVVGGGFFLSWVFLNPKQLWEILGVRNGSHSYEDFFDKVRALGGNEDSVLASSVLNGTFILTRRDSIMIPDEFRAHFQDLPARSLLSLDEPIGKYLEKIVNEVRVAMLDAYGQHWPGIYYVASNRNSRSYIQGFTARVMNAYEFRCAITGTSARPVLEVAHLQPFYDHNFQSVQNGILLRCDVQKMFNTGYITLEYKNDDEIAVKVSRTIKSVWAEDYAVYNGKKIFLPKDRALWPKKEYIEWHQKNCFEHWLKVGGSHVR